MGLSRALAVNVEDDDGGIDPIILTKEPGELLGLRIGARGKQLTLSDDELGELIDALREMQVTS